MRSILAFAAIQLIIYIFSMSNPITIGILVLATTALLFLVTYLNARVKDRRHRRKTVDAALEIN